jgi:NADH-quinone oxidoreductase subunit M
VRFIMMTLSIIGIVYGALVSLMQKDMKKLVAYSSVSHLGFCTLGIFAVTSLGCKVPSCNRSTTESPPAHCS